MGLSINKRKISTFPWFCKIKWKVSVKLWNPKFHNSVSPNIKTTTLTLYCPSHTTKSALTSKDVNFCCSWRWSFALYPVRFVRWWTGVSFPSVILLHPVYWIAIIKVQRSQTWARCLVSRVVPLWVLWTSGSHYPVQVFQFVVTSIQPFIGFFLDQLSGINIKYYE